MGAEGLTVDAIGSQKLRQPGLGLFVERLVVPEGVIRIERDYIVVAHLEDTLFTQSASSRTRRFFFKFSCITRRITGSGDPSHFSIRRFPSAGIAATTTLQ